MRQAVLLLLCPQKGGDKLGYEAEALAIYDTMRYVKPAVGTVCVGSAYGEAALLLAAGEKVPAAVGCDTSQGNTSGCHSCLLRQEQSTPTLLM
jgi:Clp protease